MGKFMYTVGMFLCRYIGDVQRCNMRQGCYNDDSGDDIMYQNERDGVRDGDCSYLLGTAWADSRYRCTMITIKGTREYEATGGCRRDLPP